MSTDSTTFDRLSYLCDEQAWVRRLDYAIHAESIETFKKRLVDWLLFFPDAAKQVDAIKSWGDYEEFRRGLQSEREKVFAGEEWYARFAAIMVPGNAMRATAIAMQFHAPWGAALMRVAEVEAHLSRRLPPTSRLPRMPGVRRDGRREA